MSRPALESCPRELAGEGRDGILREPYLVSRDKYPEYVIADTKRGALCIIIIIIATLPCDEKALFLRARLFVNTQNNTRRKRESCSRILEDLRFASLSRATCVSQVLLQCPSSTSNGRETIVTMRIAIDECIMLQMNNLTLFIANYETLRNCRMLTRIYDYFDYL